MFSPFLFLLFDIFLHYFPCARRYRRVHRRNSAVGIGHPLNGYLLTVLYAHYATFQQTGNSRSLYAVNHFVEHLVTLLLIGDYGVLLSVTSQPYSLSELVHSVNVVNPVLIYAAQKLVPFDLMIVHLSVRHFGNILNFLFVSFYNFL